MIAKRSLLVALAPLLAFAACVPAPYVWVDAYEPPLAAPEPYRLQPGDKLNILVWNQAQLSGPVTIRPDGSGGVPLVGDVALAGLTPADAAEQIARRLVGLVVDPNVTITVAESRAAIVTVMGEVKTPGVQAIQPGDGLLQVLARSGGVTDFASHTGVYILRSEGGRNVRIRFDLDKMTRGQASLSFLMRNGDVIVVE